MPAPSYYDGEEKPPYSKALNLEFISDGDDDVWYLRTAQYFASSENSMKEEVEYLKTEVTKIDYEEFDDEEECSFRH